MKRSKLEDLLPLAEDPQQQQLWLPSFYVSKVGVRRLDMLDVGQVCQLGSIKCVSAAECCSGVSWFSGGPVQAETFSVQTLVPSHLRQGQGLVHASPGFAERQVSPAGQR